MRAGGPDIYEGIREKVVGGPDIYEETREKVAGGPDIYQGDPRKGRGGTWRDSGELVWVRIHLLREGKRGRTGSEGVP